MGSDYFFPVFIALLFVVGVIAFINASDTLVAKTAECFSKQGVLVRTPSESICIKAELVQLTAK